MQNLTHFLICFMENSIVLLCSILLQYENNMLHIACENVRTKCFETRMLFDFMLILLHDNCTSYFSRLSKTFNRSILYMVAITYRLNTLLFLCNNIPRMQMMIP